MILPEGLLHRMQLAVLGQALDGHHRDPHWRPSGGGGPQHIFTRRYGFVSTLPIVKR